MDIIDVDEERVHKLTSAELHNLVKECFSEEEFARMSRFDKVKYRVLCSVYLRDQKYLQQFTLREFLTRKVPNPEKLYPQITGSPRRYPAPKEYDGDFWHTYSDSSSDGPKRPPKVRKLTLEEMWDLSDDEHRLERAVLRERALLAAKRKPRVQGAKKKKPPPKKRGRKRRAAVKQPLRPVGAGIKIRRKRRTKAELTPPVSGGVSRAKNAPVTRSQAAAVRAQANKDASQRPGTSGATTKTANVQKTEVKVTARKKYSRARAEKSKLKNARNQSKQKTETKLPTRKATPSKIIVTKCASETSGASTFIDKAKAMEDTEKADTKQTIQSIESNDVTEEAGVSNNLQARKRKMPRRRFIPPPPPACFYDKPYNQDESEEYSIPPLPNPSFRDVYYPPFNTCQCTPTGSKKVSKIEEIIPDLTDEEQPSTSGFVTQRTEPPPQRHFLQPSSHIPIFPPPIAPYTHKRFKTANPFTFVKTFTGIEVPTMIQTTTSIEIPTSVETPTCIETPTSIEIPTSIEEIPTSIDEIPTSIDEIPASIDEIPTSIDEIPTSSDEIPASTESAFSFKLSSSTGPETSASSGTITSNNDGLSTSTGLSIKDEPLAHINADFIRNIKLDTLTTQLPSPQISYSIPNTENLRVPKTEQSLKPIMEPGFYVQRRLDEQSNQSQSSSNASAAKTLLVRENEKTKHDASSDKPQDKKLVHYSIVAPDPPVSVTQKKETFDVRPQLFNKCPYMILGAPPRVSFAKKENERDKRMQPKRLINRKKFVIACKPHTIVISDRKFESSGSRPPPFQEITGVLTTNRQNIVANETGSLKVVPNPNRADISRPGTIASVATPGQQKRATKIILSDIESPNIENSAESKPPNIENSAESKPSNIENSAESKPSNIENSAESKPSNFENSAESKPIIKKSAVIPSQPRQSKIKVPPHVKPCPTHCLTPGSQTKPRLAKPKAKKSNLLVNSSQSEPTISSPKTFVSLPESQILTDQQAQTETAQDSDVRIKDIRTYQGLGKSPKTHTEVKEQTSDSLVPIVQMPGRTLVIQTPPARNLARTEVTIVPVSRAEAIRSSFRLPEIQPLVSLHPIVKSTVSLSPNELKQILDLQSGLLSPSSEDQEIITIEFPPNVDQSQVRALLSPHPIHTEAVPYVKKTVPLQHIIKSTNKQISKNLEAKLLQGKLIRIPRLEVGQTCQAGNITSSMSQVVEQTKLKAPSKAEPLPTMSFLRQALESPKPKSVLPKPVLPKTVPTLNKSQSQTKTIAITGRIPNIFETRRSVNTQIRTVKNVHTLSHTSSAIQSHTQTKTESITMLQRTINASTSSTVVSQSQLKSYSAQTLRSMATTTTANTTIMSQSQIKICRDRTGNAIEAQVQIKTAALTQIKENTQSSSTERQELRTIQTDMSPLNLKKVARIQVVRTSTGDIKAIRGPGMGIEELSQIQQVASENNDPTPSTSSGYKTLNIRMTGTPILPSVYPYRRELNPIHALPSTSTLAVTTQGSVDQSGPVLSVTRVVDLQKLLSEVRCQFVDNKKDQEAIEGPSAETSLVKSESSETVLTVEENRPDADSNLPTSSNQFSRIETIEKSFVFSQTRTVVAPTLGTSTSTVSRLSKYMKVLSPVCTTTRQLHATLPLGYYSTQSGSTRISLVEPGIYQVIRSPESGNAIPRLYTADEMLAAQGLTAIDEQQRCSSFTRPLTLAPLAAHTTMSAVPRTLPSSARPAIGYVGIRAVEDRKPEVEETLKVEETPKSNQNMMGK